MDAQVLLRGAFESVTPFYTLQVWEEDGKKNTRVKRKILAQEDIQDTVYVIDRGTDGYSGSPQKERVS